MAGGGQAAVIKGVAVNWEEAPKTRAPETLPYREGCGKRDGELRRGHAQQEQLMRLVGVESAGVQSLVLCRGPAAGADLGASVSGRPWGGDLPGRESGEGWKGAARSTSDETGRAEGDGGGAAGEAAGNRENRARWNPKEEAGRAGVVRGQAK